MNQKRLNRNESLSHQFIHFKRGQINPVSTTGVPFLTLW